MGQDPDAIRQEIEQTRQEMSETIDAIGYKADVPARTKDRVNETVETAKGKVTGTVDTVKEKLGVGGEQSGGGPGLTDRVGDARSNVTGRVSDATSTISDRTPSAQDVKQGARRAVGVAQSNPLGLAIGSIAVGFLAGMLVPSTRIEDEKLGPVADQVKEQVRETGQEALERGKQVAQEAAEAAKSTAQESGQQHAEGLKQSAQESAQDTQQTARTQTRSTVS